MKPWASPRRVTHQFFNSVKSAQVCTGLVHEVERRLYDKNSARLRVIVVSGVMRGHRQQYGRNIRYSIDSDFDGGPEVDRSRSCCAPGVNVAKLWGDPANGAFGAFFRLPAGFAAPVHTHTHSMKAVIVSGTYTTIAL